LIAIKITISFFLTLILWTALSGWVVVGWVWTSQQYESDLMVTEIYASQNNYSQDQSKSLYGQVFIKLALIRVVLVWIAILMLVWAIVILRYLLSEGAEKKGQKRGRESF